jgi:hypothetical protein
MITINHCDNCRNLFMIPTEYFDGIQRTFFICPDCHSRKWRKLTDSSYKTTKKS